MKKPVNDHRILKESVNRLYENLANRLVINLIAASVLVFGFFDGNPLIVKQYWFGAMCLLIGFQLADFTYWRNAHTKDSFSIVQALTRFRVGAWTMATAYATYSVIIFNSMPLIEFATLVIIFASLSSGTTAMFASDKILSSSYCVILLLPISTMGAFSEQTSHNILSILGFVFAFVMCTMGIRTSNFTKNAIATKFQNIDLLEDKDRMLGMMKNQSKQIIKANQELESKVEERSREIYKMANIDPLTGLLNRSAFLKLLNDKIEQASVAKEGFAILFIDLDGFKAINDINGHRVGDEVLSLTSKRMQSVIEIEHKICRWGGDEFVVLIDDIDQTLAVSLGNDLIFTISTPIQIGLNILGIGATVGISMYPRHAHSADELIELADDAMYRQKQTEKSKVLAYSEALRIERAHAQNLQAGLATALQKQQLTLAFQPVVDKVNKDIQYLEALMRWRFDGTAIETAQFIKVAENFGHIHAIGKWAIHESIEHALKWQEVNDIKLALNISSVQFLQSNFTAIIKHALETTGLSPNCICLEIQEDVLRADTKKIKATISDLKHLGVELCIDNFGMSDVGISKLYMLNFDHIKINTRHTKDNAEFINSLIKTTIFIAKKANKKVTLKNIETLEQAEYYEKLNCDYLQGHYYASPEPSSEETYRLKN
ncbi:bifunctional diguanylate cyclase/phosphodiesterase [Glaciecola sp. KUL10]|uniref:putative bifunctional diguanylate cyclase/phosphodiesterase n=1 Tax=Glaciecola sp. (strain KUL10) TaxID=2161813 RepID=UPI001314044C|nr:EAL domain-containing protein [Glaciecola sp. KUL10]